MPISATGNSGQRGFKSSWRSAEHGFKSSWRSAEHGFKSSWRSAEHGFSLVELMVVIAIIGLMSAVVVLRPPSAKGPPLVEAQRLAAALTATRTEAVSSARAIRVTLGAGPPRAQRRRKGQWEDVPAKAFGLKDWPAGVTAAPAVLIFDPTGLVAGPQSLVLTRVGGSARITVETEGEIRVSG